ncbi:MAG: hypothetical protein K9M54_00560 [Kiritimatiellales bacterium]|nr:hypothetical protein [Kiritimatiellales bacterium]MCF7864230.1 hypothetical protein [Kiritimatiellales bacterium]
MSQIREQLGKINAVLTSICDWDEFFENQRDELLFSQEVIDEYEEEELLPEEIDMDFPGEVDRTTIETKELQELYDDILSIDCSNPSCIKTKLRRYYIVEISGSTRDFFPEESIDIHHTVAPGVSMGVVSNSIIVGLAATKLGEYDSDYWGTISQYYAVEIIYDSEERILPRDEEQKILFAMAMIWEAWRDAVQSATVGNLKTGN